MRGVFESPAVKFLLYYVLSVFFILFIISTLLYPYYKGGKFLSPFVFDRVRWYGILISASIIIGTILVYKRRDIYKINTNDIDRLILYGVVAGFVGARLYYVLFQRNLYTGNPIRIFFVWEGGLAIHGAIFGAIVVGLLYAKKRKIPFLRIADLFSPAVVLGQAIGRWGNFFNHEAFGYPTSLPWKMFIPMAFRPIEFKKYAFFHPTFLYESIGSLGIFFLLLYKEQQSKRKDGDIFFTYLLLYSILRFFIEWLRTDSLMLLNIRIAQLVSLFLIGVSLYFLKK